MQEKFLKKFLEKFQTMQNENLRFAILGGGVTGYALGNFLKRKNIPFFILDSTAKSQSFSVYSDQTAFSDLPAFSVILKSPGVSPSHPILQEAKARAIPVWSEIQLARAFFKGKIIGITGTDGKSTTTALATHLLAGDFPKTRMGGNIGTAFIDFCEEDLDFAVLELSSYQLEDSDSLFLNTACILNIANDHLERHGTLENYIAAKMKIFSMEDPHHSAILNHRQKELFSFPDNYSGEKLFFGTSPECRAYIREDKSIQTRLSVYDTQDFPLAGFHNLENLAVSILMAELNGAKPKTIQSRIQNFQGLSHRFQKVHEYKNFIFINDSKSTNLHSMLAGIKGYTEHDFFLLILGGRPKSESLEPLLERLKKLNLKLYLFGEIGKLWKENIELHVKKEIQSFETLDSLIQYLKSDLLHYPACPIIFSPAGASFDLYRNFEERGEHFTQLVKSNFPQ